jgi:autotransporter-associated beta strand protein
MKRSCVLFLQTLILLFALLGATQLASAASDTWVGNTDNTWGTAANWSPAVTPVAGDSLSFGAVGTSGPILNNTLTAGTAFSGLTFNGGSAFTLNGNGILLSGSASNTIAIANNSGVAQVITMPLTNNWGYYTFSSPGATLALNGGLTLNLGGVAYFDPNVTSSSLGTDTSGLIAGLGGAGLMYSGSTFTGLATTNGSGGIVAYTAWPSVVAAPGVIGATTPGTDANIELTDTAVGSYTLANGAGITYANTIFLNNASANLLTLASTAGAQTLDLGGLSGIGGIYLPAGATAQAVKIGSGSSTILTAGPETGGAAPGTIVFAINGTSSASQANNNSSIANNGSGGAVTVVKTGTGSMNFTTLSSYTNNNYSGGTYVNQGMLTASNVASFSSGPIYVAAGATAFFVPSGTIANAITLSPGHGTSYTVNGTTGSALALGGAGSTLTGTLTLQGAPVTTDPTTAIGASLGDRITLVESSNGHNFNLNGQITGTGTLELYDPLHSENFFLGNTNLVNLNNWTGGLILETPQNTFSKLNAANQLNGNTVTLIGASGKTCRLDLNGHSDTFGGLIAADNAANQLDNFATTSCTLTLGANGASGTFGGTMDDGHVAGKLLNLVKIGAGTQTMRGANTIFGTVTISNGTFALAGSATLPNAPTITVASGATFDASGIGGFTVGAAKTLAGLGTVVGSTVINGTVKPFLGTVGTLTNNGSVTFGPGGSYVWDINNATGTAGTDSGWSLLRIIGNGLAITATSGSQFNIKITSLTAGDVAGNAANFNPNVSASWTLVQGDSPITGFDPAVFTLDTTAFSNPRGSGAFTIGLSLDTLSLVLSFTTTPVITTALVNQTNCAGSTAVFTVVANGATHPPITYQWLQNGNPLSNGGTSASGAAVTITSSGTTSTLSIAGVQAADAGGITVNVSDNGGAMGTSGATLTVIDPPSNLNVVQSPDPTVNGGGVTRFTVTADGTAPFTYVWSRNGVSLVNGGHISGANTATLAVDVSAADAGSYIVQVSNACGSPTTTGSPSVLATVDTVPGQIIYEPFSSYAPQVFRPASDTWEGVTNLFNQITGEPAWWFHSSGSGIQMIVQLNDMGNGINNQNGGSYPWPGLAGNSPNCLYWTESLNSHLEFAQSGFAPGTTVYVSFILSCLSLGSVNGVEDVIAGFASPNDGTAFNWKLCTQVSNFGASQYLLGLAKGDGHAGAQGVDANTTWASTPTLSQEDVFVVGCYTVNTGGTNATDDTVSLWINPDPATFNAAAAPAPTIGPSSFGVTNSAIRDFAVHSVVAPASHRIADLRIGTTWASVTPPPGPTLTVVSSPPNVIISWSTNWAGYVLESTPTLVPTNWTPITPPPPPYPLDSTGTNYGVSVSAGTGPKFFHLKK